MSFRHYAFLLLLPAVPLIQTRIDRSPAEFHARSDVLYVWSGERIKRMFPGFENVMADIYWLRTVQYYGGERAYSVTKRFALLRPLVEITTTLDPRLEIAYRYGAIFLSEPFPIGAGDADAGIAVLEKGVRALPDSWRLRQDLGFCWFLYKDDPKRASEVLLQASTLAGAPFFLKPLAAGFLAQGGQREQARVIWRELYRQAESGPIRDNARWHLQRLDALDTLDVLNRLVVRFTTQAGRAPASLRELVAAGILRAIPRDPSGTPYAYDPETGRVALDPSSTFWRPGGG